MCTGERILFWTKHIGKTNNTLVIFAINKGLLSYRQLDSVLTESVLWTLLYCCGVQIFEERQKPRKKMCVIICTLFDYRAWLSLCDRGIKHGSFMTWYNVLNTEWYFYNSHGRNFGKNYLHISQQALQKLYYCHSQTVIARCKLTSASVVVILRLRQIYVNRFGI